MGGSEWQEAWELKEFLGYMTSSRPAGGCTRPCLNKYISKEGNNIPITQRLGTGKFPDEKMPQLLLSGTIFLSSGLISVAGIKYPD